MVEKIESEEHRRIKLALTRSFERKSWVVERIDGEGEQTNIVRNEDGVGDGEDKRPDVDAKDPIVIRIIRGEAKINNGDFDSEHSITQYKSFFNLELNGVDSWLIVGVPNGSKNEMEAILDEALNEAQRKRVAVWEY